MTSTSSTASTSSSSSTPAGTVPPPSAAPRSAPDWSSLTPKVMEEAVDVALAVQNAKFVIVVAGAGLSADSGLPVYADIAKVKNYEENDITYKELCDPQLLGRNPKLFWSFWGECYNAYKDAQPNRSYAVLKKLRKRLEKRLQRQLKSGATRGEYLQLGQCLDEFDAEGAVPRTPFFVITSNVDRQFRRAGFPPKAVRELHGSTEMMQCSEPCRHEKWPLRDDYRLSLPEEEDIYYDVERASNPEGASDRSYAPKSSSTNSGSPNGAHSYRTRSARLRSNAVAGAAIDSSANSSAPSSSSSLAGGDDSRDVSRKRLRENDETSEDSCRGPEGSSAKRSKSSPFPEPNGSLEHEFPRSDLHAACMPSPSASTAPLPHAVPPQGTSELATHDPITRLTKKKKKKAPARRMAPKFSSTGLTDPGLQCKFCDRVARPNVLMFGQDKRWIGDAEGHERWQVWKSALVSTLQAFPRSEVVIFEIGVGTRVPKLSHLCLDLHEELNKAAENSTRLARINLEPGASSLVATWDLQARAEPFLTYLYSLVQTLPATAPIGGFNGVK